MVANFEEEEIATFEDEIYVAKVIHQAFRNEHIVKKMTNYEILIYDRH